MIQESLCKHPVLHRIKMSHLRLLEHLMKIPPRSGTSDWKPSSQRVGPATPTRKRRRNNDKEFMDLG